VNRLKQPGSTEVPGEFLIEGRKWLFGQSTRIAQRDAMQFCYTRVAKRLLGNRCYTHGRLLSTGLPRNFNDLEQHPSM
jgi:hypothetical protein